MNPPRNSSFWLSINFNILLLGAITSTLPKNEALVQQWSRRDMIIGNHAAAAALILSISPPPATAKDNNLQNFVYNNDWSGTGLPLLNINSAAKLTNFDMGRWPDPILRRPARPVEDRWFRTEALETVTKLLRNVAKENEAVGLAAQQCGIDARIVYLELPPSRQKKKQNDNYVTMVNPIITERSPETEMKVWTEYCLVLPPTFRATVLRDAWVVVDYRDAVTGSPKKIRLTGETGRAVQHELDHDRGILTLDHVGLEDLENDVMRNIERDGHDDRQELAFDRAIMIQE